MENTNVKIVTRIEAEMTNGKIYAYEVPSVKAIDAPSPGFYRIVFNDNNVELLYTEHLVRAKLWFKDVPSIALPSTAEIVDREKAREKRTEKRAKK